jgi:hypothetical protein
LAGQNAGSLARFVGAGVSILPPSSCPNFRDLVNQVASDVLALEANINPSTISLDDRRTGALKSTESWAKS